MNLHRMESVAFFIVAMQAVGVALLLTAFWFMRREVANWINRFKTRGVRWK